MQPYLDLMQDILNNGVERIDRTGTGTLSVFGRQMRFDLSANQFPLLTTKKLHVHSIIGELLWFLRGETHLTFLHENNIHIWDEWADANGQLGPLYGYQWRRWPTYEGKSIDQISHTIQQIKEKPYSRRHLISAWNVADIAKMALPPCHVMFQFYVAEDKLSCLLLQRSSDHFLGCPFNIASYALLTRMIAQQCDLGVKELIWMGGDCHLYLNHLQQAQLQLSRAPYPLPKLEMPKKPKDIFSYTVDNFKIINYQFHPHIKAPIAV